MNAAKISSDERVMILTGVDYSKKDDLFLATKKSHCNLREQVAVQSRTMLMVLQQVQMECRIIPLVPCDQAGASFSCRA